MNTNERWNTLKLKDYVENLKANEDLFRREFLCIPILEYCHDFDKKHYFVKNRCEICGIKYSKFRELVERI